MAKKKRIPKLKLAKIDVDLVEGTKQLERMTETSQDVINRQKAKRERAEQMIGFDRSKMSAEELERDTERFRKRYKKKKSY